MDQGIVQGQGTYRGPIYTTLQTILGPMKEKMFPIRERVHRHGGKENQVVGVPWLTTEVKATT